MSPELIATWMFHGTSPKLNEHRIRARLLYSVILSVYKRDSLRLTVLKRVLNKLRELLSKAIDLRYVSVPIWRPWRDF
jgi:hypothetical protein